MAAGGTGERTWKYMLGGGGAVVGIGLGVEYLHLAPEWFVAVLLAVGGLATVFGACESMIKSVEGMGVLLGWSDFVAGTMAGLASNIPELVMLGFIVAQEPRLAFVLVALTLHIGALAFGAYSAVLPRGPKGKARLPEVLVKLSTDMFACAAMLLFTIGALMLSMKSFDAPGGESVGLRAIDLYMLGGGLLAVEFVFVWRMVSRFGGEEGNTSSDSDESGGKGAKTSGESANGDRDSGTSVTVGAVAVYGLLGVGGSFLGGHAVGDFADILVAGLESYGYSEMFGALILAFFACSGVLAMIVTAHLKGKYDLALANVSGAVTQVPFVVMPIVIIMHAAFAQIGIVETLPNGDVLPIDIQTAGVVLLGFPPMAVLWKSISDDGTVNWVETTSMTVIFVTVIFVLTVHG